MIHYEKRVCGMLLLLVPLTPLFAQQQEVGTDDEKPAVADNELNVNLFMLGHGEMRLGGLDDEMDEAGKTDDKAYFIMERTRLVIDYKREGLETKLTAQHSGIWGQKGQGNFNLYEAWAKLSARNGLFAQIGRQALSYDDERIIGTNDWAMAALSHDVVRLGYEGHGHKAHAIFAFNQNSENIYGGTYYNDGSQPYKTMQTVWYHYDFPKIPFGASLLFMNIGMQAGEKDGQGDNRPRTEFQQLLGTYLSYKSDRLTAEGAYYRQMGKDEHSLKIKAWMASAKVKYKVSDKVSAVLGYDYLSGDKHFAVPEKGRFGVVRHKEIGGFNPIYGSHHKFYGMMDFFYVRTYLNGFTPGLQNLYVGGEYSPVKDLMLKLNYHYMATATKLENINRTLGHDIDFEASYKIMKDVKLSVGFSYMAGDETMEKLKRAEKNNNLKWGWFSLVVSPHIFTMKW